MSGVFSQRFGLRRSKTAATFVLLALVLAACGGDASEPVSNTDGSTDTTLFSGVSETTVAGGEDTGAVGTTQAPSDENTTASSQADEDLQDAPDFTLELGEGGEFVLSAETKPVYLIFWAEW